jgi:Sulfotransferase family
VLPLGERITAVSVRPVFVLSLPRSGSTLLQRMLATHPDVATTSEPWLLLPQLYALRETGATAEYGHRTAARAIADFAAALPGGRDAYLAEVQRSAIALYERASGAAAWFLDKTPRYHLVVDEIMALFPDARFVFLWRNPLAVAASMIDSFGGGHWNLDRYEVDLHGGIDRLVAAHARRDPRAVALRFEDVVADPVAATQAVFELLGLDPAEAAAEAFAGTSLNGRMGDRTGTVAYTEISGEPIERWRATMANPLRKRWCAGYLRSVGPERLAAMGYDYEELARQVAGLRTRPAGIASDAARRAYGYGRMHAAGRLLARGSRPAPTAPTKSGARP